MQIHDRRSTSVGETALEAGLRAEGGRALGLRWEVCGGWKELRLEVELVLVSDYLSQPFIGQGLSLGPGPIPQAWKELEMTGLTPA